MLVGRLPYSLAGASNCPSSQPGCIRIASLEGDLEREERFERPRRAGDGQGPETEVSSTARRRRGQPEQSQAALLSLLGELEGIIESGMRVPFTSKVLIDRDVYLDTIDAIQLAVPEAMVQAERIVRDRDRIIAQADAEAERVVSQAKEEAAFLISERQLLRTAEIQSQAILEAARDEAKEVISSAHKYVSDLMAQMENEAQRVLAEIRRAASQVRQNAS